MSTWATNKVVYSIMSVLAHVESRVNRQCGILLQILACDVILALIIGIWPADC